MTKTVSLKIAIANHAHTAAVKDGTIPIEGVTAEFVNVVPQIAAYRRMVRNVEFDVCELAPTTYLIARSLGAPFVALPIFVMRRFHHRGLLVRPGANIATPKDLEGKKVGVRAYSVTSGVWTRGILMDEYGLDSAKVTWVVDDEEHVQELKLPPNVEHAPQGTSLAQMMAEGEIDAGLAGNAGIGRSGSPSSGWKQEEANYPELFSDAREREAEWYGRTGIYPIHGTIVVKEQVLKDNPWVAQVLFDAFSQAKTQWLERLDSGEADTAADKTYREHREIVGNDPLPFGIRPNLPAIAALLETTFRQKLIAERISLGDAFFDSETV